MRLTDSEGLQIRRLPLDFKRELLHECIDENISMATLLRRMWDAYAKARGYESEPVSAAKR